nr:hypothetical protein Itr_chr05CG03420 [Ipomoea trifida]
MLTSDREGEYATATDGHWRQIVGGYHLKSGPKELLVCAYVDNREGMRIRNSEGWRPAPKRGRKSPKIWVKTTAKAVKTTVKEGEAGDEG